MQFNSSVYSLKEITAPQAAGAPRKALVVDDDPAIRNLVSALLVAEGYEVETAVNGPECMSMLMESDDEIDYSVIILDVRMPGMSGLEVLQRVKNDPSLGEIPVVMLTAEDKPEDLMKGYANGADYYITKPFTRKQLLFGLRSI